MTMVGIMRQRLFRNISSIVGVCLFVATIFVIQRELREYHLHDIVRQIDLTPGTNVAGAVALTILNYLVLTSIDALGMRYVRHPLAYHRLALAAFVTHVFSNNVTVIGGSAARYRIYSALGISASEVTELVLFCGLTFWLGFFTVAGAVFLIEPYDVPQELRMPFRSIWVLGVVFLLVMGIYLAGTILRRKPLKIRTWEVRVPSPAIAISQIAISSLDWLLAATVLYLLLPGEIHAGFVRSLAVFMLAQIAGLLSHVPAGLGVFETVFLFSFADTGNTAALAASLLLYRLIYYILPLILASVLLTLHEVLPHVAAVRRIGIHIGKWGSLVIPQVFALAVFVAGAILLSSGICLRSEDASRSFANCSLCRQSSFPISWAV